MSKWKLNRRAMLKGIGGAAVALPFLEIMGDSSAQAGGMIPKRYLVAAAGTSLGSGRVHINETLVPDTEGFDYDLKPALEPFAGGTLPSGATYADVRDEISVVTGLRIPWAGLNAGVVPNGGRPDNHHTMMTSPLFSGVASRRGADSARCVGPTSDQVVADAIGNGTTFKSLQYCVQVSSYLNRGGLGGRAFMSYRDNGDGRGNQSIRPQNSPRAAWDELFYNFEPADPAEAAAREFDRRARGTILDVVRAQSERLERRLGNSDKLRMQKHFAEIRDLERRLDMLGPEVEGACMALDDPGRDPDFGGNRALVDDETPYDINNGYSNEDLRAEIFCRLIHMAFACDLTRSVSLMMTHFQSWMNVYELTGRAADQHQLGHSGERHATRGIGEMLGWHYKHFSALIDMLRNDQEADGSSLLDHCALVFTHEGGYGIDATDGALQRSHSTENMVCLIAGRAGGLVPGQHVHKLHAHPAQVLVSAMTAVGLEDETLGEVEGVIPELFTEP